MFEIIGGTFDSRGWIYSLSSDRDIKKYQES
jgi:hypothetical protein